MKTPTDANWADLATRSADCAARAAATGHQGPRPAHEMAVRMCPYGAGPSPEATSVGQTPDAPWSKSCQTATAAIGTGPTDDEDQG